MAFSPDGGLVRAATVVVVTTVVVVASSGVIEESDDPPEELEHDERPHTSAQTTSTLRMGLNVSVSRVG